jgi:hypothetical protein
MKKLLILILIIFCGVAVAQQYPELPLEKILSMDEQKAIGVHKLSDAEKEKLRILIIEKYLAGFEQGKKEGIEQATKNIGRQQNAPSSDVIESQIDGDYEGWEGETIVKLMNGQIWQQKEYYYHYHYAFMPKVLIYKSGSGYKLKVDGVEKAVGVTRLK